VTAASGVVLRSDAVAALECESEEILDRHGRAIVIARIRTCLRSAALARLSIGAAPTIRSAGPTTKSEGRWASFPPQDDLSPHTGLDIDEQSMNEAILNPHASERRRSHAEDSGADSDYANIVAELRQLRAASQLNRYRGAAPRLPSREAINEIVESLVSALYPRHFGPPGLDARDADAFVARTLAKALPALGHEIERRWPSSRRTRATRPMRTFDPRLRSRARLPRLCRRFAPPSTRPRRFLERPVSEEHRRDYLLLSRGRRDHAPPPGARALPARRASARADYRRDRPRVGRCRHPPRG
jgi:hypothetical protein